MERAPLPLVIIGGTSQSGIWSSSAVLDKDGCYSMMAKVLFKQDSPVVELLEEWIRTAIPCRENNLMTKITSNQTSVRCDDEQEILTSSKPPSTVPFNNVIVASLIFVWRRGLNAENVSISGSFVMLSGKRRSDGGRKRSVLLSACN